LLFVIFLIGLVLLLPILVAKTPLLDVVIAAAVPADAIRVTVGEASLSWFSPPTAARIHITDAAGGNLLAVESIRCDRSLWSLVTNSRELGQIEITRPTLFVSVRPDGSNVEDALGKLLAKITNKPVDQPVDGGKSRTAAVTLRVAEAAMLMQEIATGRKWRAEGMNVQFDSHGPAAAAGQFSLSGHLIEEPSPQGPGSTGRFAAVLGPVAAGDPQKRQLSWKLEGLSLEAAGPWLRRAIADVQLGGTLSGEGAASWTSAASGAALLPGDLATSGTLVVDRLDAGASLLAGDRVRLARVELPWRISSQPAGLLPPRLLIEDLQLKSDVGQLTARGQVDATGGQHDVEVRGALNVARLAAMLPHVLRVRADTTITAGTIELAARQQPAVGGQLLTGSLRTVQLAATSGGRPLRWDAPVSASFAVRRGSGGIRVDSLQCASEFLNVDASGTVEQLTASARFDLNRLSEQLNQFFDLSGIELAGTGTAKAEWQLAGGSQFIASANGDLSQLRVGSAGGVWAEPQLAIRISANGTLDVARGQLTRVEAARVEISGQGDLLDARLAAPVDVSQRTSWPASVRAAGGVGRWLTRVRPWADAGDWNVDGQSEFSANLRVADNAIGASDVKLVITDLRAVHPHWSIREPRIEFAGDARWDGASGTAAADKAQFVTSTVSLAVKDIRLAATPQGGPRVSGAAAFRADLERLAAWRASPQAAQGGPQPFRPQGQVSGNLKLVEQAGRSTGEFSVVGQNLTLTQWTPAQGGRPAGYQTIWQEPELTARGLAAVDSSADRLSLDQLQIESQTLTASINGRVEKLSTLAETTLNGTLNYDLAQLTPLLRPYVGAGVQLTGREQARFAVAGRLRDNSHSIAAAPVSLTLNSQPSTLNQSHWSRRVQGRLELPWSGANVYGLPVSGGRIAAALSGGAVQVEPLALAVSDGRLTASPQVRLDPAPMELTLPAGPLLAGVRISPEVSEAMLKYIAPVLAGATQSEGHFSLSLDGARVPLGDAAKADAGGQLTVHSVRVVPGPLATQWITLAKRIESLVKQPSALSLAGEPAAPADQRQISLLSIRDQQVNFRVVDGRVHHQNMEFQVDDVVLRSQGSVGLDETISLVLSVPIQDRWIERQRSLAGLKGQSLQIPITGTLTRPRMDEAALANISAQLIQSAAGQAVGNELNRALDKLFKPK
jgi:hypothetical protein